MLAVSVSEAARLRSLAWRVGVTCARGVWHDGGQIDAEAATLAPLLLIDAVRADELKLLDEDAHAQVVARRERRRGFSCCM